jgi:hypothetical protein
MTFRLKPGKCRQTAEAAAARKSRIRTANPDVVLKNRVTQKYTVLHQ